MTLSPDLLECKARQQDDLLENYIIHRKIGNGTYGTVYQATQKTSGHCVAIKIVRHLDNPLVCRRTLREIKFLQHFKHQSIVSLLDVARPNSIHNFSEACLIQEYMPRNLTQVIKQYELSELQISHLTRQLLLGLHTIHRTGIIHRDLKPDNLLVGPNCELKICDFGLARSQFTGRGKRMKMSEYVATRWYRAPEIMLSRYGKSSDVWSSGCVLAEMLGKKVLFPGRDYTHQLDLIFTVLGSPTDEDLKARYSSRSIHYIRTALPLRVRTPWKDIFPEASGDSLSLLNRLLTFNMDDRITVEDALQHQFVQPWRGADDVLHDGESMAQTFLDCGDTDNTVDASAKCELFDELVRASDRTMCSRVLLQLSASLA